jgi:hypothetical protein
MNLPKHPGLLPLLPVAALCACFPASKSLGEGETEAADSTSGSESDSASGQDSASGNTTTGQATGMSGTASESDSESSGASGTATSTSGPGTASDTEATAGGTDTTGGVEVCELEPIVTEATMNTKSLEPIDCGYLTLQDPLSAWQAGQDCAMQADSMGETFRLLWDMQGIDSQPSRGIAGLQGFVYGRVEYFEDKGGLAGGRTVSQRQCDSFLIPPDCAPEVGLICLTCDNTGDTDLICSVPE